MKWEKEPTVEGFYWLSSIDRKKWGTPYICYIMKRKSKWEYGQGFESEYLCSDDRVMGPLEMPEKPEL